MHAKTERTRAALRLLKAGITQAAALTLRAAVEAAEKDEKATTLFRDRSGDTRASIKGTVIGLRGVVRAGGAARWLENGTRPHEIAARRAKSLRFVANGQAVYRARVSHPGTAERPFVQQARDRAAMAVEFGAEFYVGYAVSHLS